MPLLSKIVRGSLIVIGLLFVVAVSCLWLITQPALKQIERNIAAGEQQMTPNKQAWILKTHDTRVLAVTGFRDASLEIDPTGWHKISTQLAGGFIIAFHEQLHTREEWAAAYCGTTECLDLWSLKAYGRAFEELSVDEASCAMQMSIGQGRFAQCDAALTNENL